MHNTIVICTNNLVPKPLFKKVLMNACTQADMVENTRVVIVSHYPVIINGYMDVNSTYNHYLGQYDEIKESLKDFKFVEHKNFSDVLIKKPFFDAKMFNCNCFNIVVGESEYNHSTIYRQLLLGAKFSYQNNVIIMEHDVLYPINYVKTVAGVLDSGMDACYWARGKFFSNSGFFSIPNIMTLSRFSMNTYKFRDVFENKLKKDLKFVEPVLDGLSIYGNVSEEITVNKFAMVHGIDTLDIRHGLNVSGNYVVENYTNSHEYWGTTSELLPLIDGPCKELVEKHPSYNYGIWS